MSYINPVVTIVYSAYQSTKGRFFAGVTQRLKFGGQTSAWARLYNPKTSQTNLFLDLYAITNFSGNPFSAHVFRNAAPSGEKITSYEVGNGNFGSSKQSIGVLQFNPCVIGNPVGGTRISVKRVPDNMTITSNVNGNAIIVPGTSFLFLLTGDKPAEAQIAFDWWENETIF